MIFEKAMYSRVVDFLEMHKILYDKQFGFNHFPYTHGEQLEKARAEYSDAYKAEMKAQFALRESQNESYISEAIASEKMIDDGERSGISNPFSKTSSSA